MLSESEYFWIQSWFAYDLQKEGVWSIRTSELLLPTRIRALLASHACRSAVMFGKELDPPALEAVCVFGLERINTRIMVPSSLLALQLDTILPVRMAII